MNAYTVTTQTGTETRIHSFESERTAAVFITKMEERTGVTVTNHNVDVDTYRW